MTLDGYVGDDRSKAPCFHIMQGDENFDCLFCLLFMCIADCIQCCNICWLCRRDVRSKAQSFISCKEMKISIVYFVCCLCVLQTVYSAVTFAGYVGVMTGQRPNLSYHARR